MCVLMTHNMSDDMTPIYTSTRVPPAETPDRTASTQISGESKITDEPISAVRIVPTAPQ